MMCLAHDPEPLSEREQLLVAIAGDVCTQSLGAAYSGHVGRAAALGISRHDLKEALLHLVIYASFPKVLCALQALPPPSPRDAARPEPPATPPSPQNLFCRPDVRDALDAIDPDFADLAMRMAGEVWGRSGLSQRERAFMCLAAHVANATPDPIPVHAEIALRAGATPRALREVLARAASTSAPAARDRAVRALDRFLATSPLV